MDCLTLSNLPDFTKASVLIVGDIMLDRYWFGETARISPEAPVPVVNICQTDERPGGAGNVALNIASLGASISLIGVTGNDEASQSLAQYLTHAGVTHTIYKLAGIPTITKLRVISRQQQLIRMDFEKKFPSFPTETLLNDYRRSLNTTKLVILSDYNKGTLCCAPALIRLAREANVPILVDPKGEDFSIYQGATLITPNFKEFEKIVGHCQDEQEILEKGRALLNRHQIDAMLLTRGEKGMILIQQDNKETLHLPAHARDVFDVTGAGDTVIAVLGTALAAGETLTEAVRIANLAASLVVGKLGACSVTPSELQAALQQHPHLPSGVVNEAELALALNKARLQGERIVFTNGCFDIIHAGHITYLQQARRLGDKLIVAINDDDSVKRLKGPSRPINSVEQRMMVLASLDIVDWVVSYTDDTPERLLHQIRPDVLVKGGDYAIDEVVGAEIVRAYGGDIRILGCVKGLSTTSLIERVTRQQPSEA